MGIFARDGRWYGRWREAGRLIRVALHTTNKREAEIRWARLQTGQEQARIAGEDPERHTSGLDPRTLIAEYIADLERRGLSTQHVRQKRVQLETLTEDIGAATIRAMTSKRIAAALKRLPAELEPRTRNDYRAAMHALFEWLVESGRWTRNPVQAIRPVRELDEPRRRALTPAELEALLAAAPRHRAIIYRLCAGCGLRRSEVPQLTREQFRLEGDKPLVTLRAAGTKARRWAEIPISRGLATAILEWFAAPSIVERGHTRPAKLHPERSREDKAATWERTKPVRGLFAPPPQIPAFEADLTAAGIPLEVNGRWLVFHSLRATYVTNLWRLGASAAEVCRYGRFKDIKTAQRYYTSFGVSDDDLMRERLEALEAGILRGIPEASPGAVKRPNLASGAAEKKHRAAQ